MLEHKSGKIKNWGGECRDITPTKLQCQIFKEHCRYLKKIIIIKKKFEKNIYFFKCSPINLLIILYQLTKFETPSWNSFELS